MKLYILFTFLMVSAQAQDSYSRAKSDQKSLSDWTVLVKHNDLIDNDSEAKFGFIGIGTSYKVSLDEAWSWTPELTVSQYVKNRPELQQDTYIAMVSLLLKYRDRYLDIFAGLSAQQMLPDYNLKRTPSLGGRVGLSYYFNDDRSSLQVGCDFMTFHEESPLNQNYKINSKTGSLSITYGFRL